MSERLDAMPFGVMNKEAYCGLCARKGIIYHCGKCYRYRCIECGSVHDKNIKLTNGSVVVGCR